MPQARYTVAIVGRPNVGKSSLFNRLIGQKVSIVDNQPGVTRDIIIRDFEWNGCAMRFLDTGGYETAEKGELEVKLRYQIQEAIAQSDALILVADITAGPTPEDAEAVRYIRRSGHPMVLALNKTDNQRLESEGVVDFLQWGIETVIPVSASHGRGTGDLLDAVVEMLPERPAELDTGDDTEAISIALVGRPNVGKSTLLNRLVGSERSLVSSIPGTTRDPVDMLLERNEKQYLLIDTAGIRRRGKIRNLERYAVARGELAIERADVVLLLIDGADGLKETDAHVFGFAYEKGKAAIILVNKWDAVEKDSHTTGICVKDIRDRCKFLRHAPIEFISAETGQRVHRIWDLIDKVYDSYKQRIPTSKLNDALQQWIHYRPPQGIRGRIPKILYITQIMTGPPSFLLFAKNPDALHLTYKRYLINQMRKSFGFEGSPIRLYVRDSRSSRDETQKPPQIEELVAEE